MVQASDKAKEEMLSWIRSKGGYKNVEFDDAIKTAYALATKYGEATASLSALMYDSIAEKTGASVPPAEVAPTVSLDEVKKTIYGASSFSQDDEYIAGTVGRMTKQAGADTTLKNAKRDGAEFAWVTSGDSCAYCELLSNFGWQHASAKTIKGDHAEHIHANCQCQFIIRFDHATTVEGYNPNPNFYNKVPGKTIEEKASNLRREKSEQKMIDYPSGTITTKEEAINKLNGWFSSVEGIDKIAEELLIDNVNRLNELNARFGVLRSNNTGYITTQPEKNAVGYAGFNFRKDIDAYRLGLNANYYKSKDAIMATYRQGQDISASRGGNGHIGYKMPADEKYATTYTVTHEYGHLLQFDIARNRQVWGGRAGENFVDDPEKEKKKQFNKMQKEIIKIARDNNPDFILSDNLSGYGHKNSKEFFAEVFANSQCGKPNELGIAMQQWLEREGY